MKTNQSQELTESQEKCDKLTNENCKLKKLLAQHNIEIPAEEKLRL